MVLANDSRAHNLLMLWKDIQPERCASNQRAFPSCTPDYPHG
jgi:hypothetical protein